MIVDCVCMRVNILVNFCIVVDGLWYGLELPVCREGAHCLHPAQGRAVKHPRGVVPGVQLSTDLREVSERPKETPTRAFSLLKVPSSTSRHFQQGVGSSRGLLCDCENFVDLRFQLYSVVT